MHTPNFVASKLSLRVIFQKARFVRELLFIDLFIVVALLGAEGGGGTCIFESNFHAFVSFMSNISWCFSSRHDYEVIFSFDFRFRLYLN